MRINPKYSKDTRIETAVPLLRKRRKLEWLRMGYAGFGLGCFAVYFLLITKSTPAWANFTALALGGAALGAALVLHRRLKIVVFQIEVCRYERRSPDPSRPRRVMN